MNMLSIVVTKEEKEEPLTQKGQGERLFNIVNLVNLVNVSIVDFTTK